MSIRPITLRNGVKAWQARVMVNGIRRSATKPTYDAARKAEAALITELGAEQRRQAEPITLRDLCDFYVADLEARGKPDDTVVRAETTAKAIETLMPEMLDRRATAFTVDEVYRFRRLRDAAGAKPGTINRDLRSIRAMLKKVMPDFRIPKDAFSPEDNTRVRWLEGKQEKRAFDIPSPFREMARLAAITLMRLTEVRTLRREMVHLGQGIVLLPRAKGGPGAVILNGEAMTILRKQLKARPGDWVFPNRDGRPYSRVHISRVFRRNGQRIGLVDFRFHDLRHHGATKALNGGHSNAAVQDFGRWKSEKMMRRYAAITDHTLRAVAESTSGTSRALAVKRPLRLVRRRR